MTSILSLYAVTPCHAGSGSSLAVVDLPIQRERHTNWPVIHASGMKGAMRACFDAHKGRIQPSSIDSDSLTELIFGSEKSEFAGSLSVSDAKILAFPMRSSFAPFVWITSPAVLSRLNRDLKFAGRSTDDLAVLQDIKKEEAFWLNGPFAANIGILIEEVEVTTSRRIDLPNIGAFLGKAERLLVVHDEIFGYAVSHCTSVAAHIAIDQQTGTTRDGSLRYQEELPSDTLMYSVVLWGDARDLKSELIAQTIKGYVTEEAIGGHLQVGGDETLGRGIFEIEWN